MHKILSQILDAKKKRVSVLKKHQDTFIPLIKKAPAVIPFKEAVKKEGKISFIAEIKQASPSAGVLRKDFSPVAIAKLFEKAKADAISVVTEEDYFLGKVNFIEEVKKEVDLPVLRKDFIFDEVQILESRAIGTDAVLLIMGVVNEEQLAKLYAFTKELGMDALVEVHTEKELKKVLKVGVDMIGINSRNLHTFQVDLERTKKLLPFIPEEVVRVSESGIQTLKDVLLLKGFGADAVLVGEALMKEENLEEKLKELNIDT